MISDLQKASLWKRASAWLFDFIIMVVATVGIITLISAIIGYDGYIDEMIAHYDRYEKLYDVDFDISTEEFELLSEEEQKKYYDADAAMNIDKAVVATYGAMVNYAILMITLGLLFSNLILEFVIPLIFKNGQTLGKKIFGVAVMRTNAVKISPVVLFIRAVLGKFTIETMVPVFLFMMVLFGTVLLEIGAFVIIGIFALDIIMMCVTATSSSIHDLLSDTVVVDMASQMIFDTEEEMFEYRSKLHREEVERSDY